MFGKIARGAFLVILAAMIVSWAMSTAMSVSNSSPAEPRQELPTDRMYS